MVAGQRTALISVYNKDGIVEFARGLLAEGFQVLSSGGTARCLQEGGVSVTDVAEVTGMKPVLDHRVVTLHHKIHGGLLALPTHAHRAELAAMGAPWIDLVCCDLYPLEEEIANPKATRESVIDKTDIGGPTLLRAAAKGRRIVVCDVPSRQRVLTWLAAGCPEEDRFITEHCAIAEARVAEYGLASARYHAAGGIDGMVGRRVQILRYGENPFQEAAFYAVGDHPLAFHHFHQVGGTDPIINATDLDRACRTMVNIAMALEDNGLQDHTDIAIAVKHGNPCGVGVGRNMADALTRMIDGDRMAIFGAVVLTNFPITEERARMLREYGMEEGKFRLLDGVITPAVSSGVCEVLERKGGKCRVLVNRSLGNLNRRMLPRVQYRSTLGGFLRQEGEPFVLFLDDERMERQGDLTPQQHMDMVPPGPSVRRA